MPTIGSRRCGIRATASHCVGVALASSAIDSGPGQPRAAQGRPSHDRKALRARRPSCRPCESSQLFDCDEQGAGPALPCPAASCPRASCLVPVRTALTAATGSLAVSPQGRRAATASTDSSAQHNLTARTWVPVGAGGSLDDLCWQDKRRGSQATWEIPRRPPLRLPQLSSLSSRGPTAYDWVQLAGIRGACQMRCSTITVP